MPCLKLEGVIRSSWTPVRNLRKISPALHRYFSHVRNSFESFTRDPLKLIPHPSTPQYTSDVSHYSLSSIQDSACSVEPGSVEDVSKIVKYSVPMSVAPDDIFFCTAKDPGNMEDAFRCKRWWTHHESRILVDIWRADRIVTLQLHKTQS